MTTTRRNAHPNHHPDYYKHSLQGVNESRNACIEDIYKSWDSLIPKSEVAVYESFLTDLMTFFPALTNTEENSMEEKEDMDDSKGRQRRPPRNSKEFEKAMSKLRRKYNVSPKKCQLLFLFNQRMAVKGEIVAEGREETAVDEQDGGDDKDFLAFSKLLIKKQQKSTSGVLVITVVTSPYPEGQKFSCEWNCYYCPNEPDQPRSYLHDEPSVLRANRNDFDPVLQFCDRAITLAMNGHPVDKIELLILGGTWASYPKSYQESFIRDLFYAANTFFDQPNKKDCDEPENEETAGGVAERDSISGKRMKLSLEEEKLINETTRVKIIGITLETRPDCINREELIRFRRYGCTRVQLGIQHTDNSILKKINRGCTNEDSIRAIRLLRDVGYKMDIHIMPNLPGSSPEKDLQMFEYILNSPDLQADQWKIYPCEVLPWTVLKQWYESGKFVPYDDNILLDLLIKIKAKVHPWIRLNRVIRDIPSQYILGGLCEPNLRQVIERRMKEQGTWCQCIRCREVKSNESALATAELVVRKYEASGGLEYFISFETPDLKTICGFVRLRITRQAGGGEIENEDGENSLIFPELKDAALIRELHVYGQMIPTMKPINSVDKDCQAQHIGFGSRLMAKAEEIAFSHGKKHIAVIAGVGVRNFYRKIGYELTTGLSEMMMKKLDIKENKKKFLGLSDAFYNDFRNHSNAKMVAASATIVLCVTSLVLMRVFMKKNAW